MTPAPPLGVYVHWPYCARICPYCDFNVFRDRKTAEAAALTDAILEDLRGQASLTGPRTLTSIFFGGGTPSLMTPEAVAAVVAEARRLWRPEPDLEVTLEANPTDAEAGRFAAFALAGVNRLSLGLQSLDDDQLRFLGRNHDAAEARRAAETAREAFPRLSLDLIYALPGQTAPAWRKALAQALDLGAEHISPYQLTIEAGTAFERAARRGAWRIPDDDQASALFDATQAVLEAAGFDAYEVSNHARGHRARSRHNLTYWRGHDYVGAGPGAHGRLGVEGARLATLGARRPADYIRQVAENGIGWSSRETMTPEACAEERLLAGLRIDEGVAYPEVAALGLAPDTPKVRELRVAGLLAPDETRLRATRRGRLVLDGLIRKLIL